MSRVRLLVVLLPWLATACVVRPADPFQEAEAALECDDLVRSLGAYDTVPVVHPRYPEARAAAAAVERRIRRCHEYILEALMLRSEWRDREALAALRRAQEQWPGQPSLDQWIAATEQRIQLFGSSGSVALRAQQTPKPRSRPQPVEKPVLIRPVVERVPTPTSADESTLPETSPVTTANAAVEPPTNRVDVDVVASRSSETDKQPARTVPPLVGPQRNVVAAPAPLAEGPTILMPQRPEPNVDAPANAAAPPSVPVVESRVVAQGSEDPVAIGMTLVEASLHRGELGDAVGALIELAQRFPEDRRVQRRLAPLLNQRALMHYGSGEVAQAVADWQRVLKLEPDNESVKAMLARALSESSRG